MIKVGDYKIEVKHFPDGTQMLFDCNVDNFPENLGKYVITWNYESDEELITLIYIVNHIRKTWPAAPIHLNMPYIPNARMDRVKNPGEVFTLKYFANIINGLHFDKVFVLDPHSDVSTALIDRVKVISPTQYISEAIEEIREDNDKNSDFVIYFPDAGAYKRYKDLNAFDGMSKIYGQKVRDWSTGNILGLKIVNEDGEQIHNTVAFDYETKGLDSNTDNTVYSQDIPYLSGKKVFMVDDIISYGGTFYYSVNELLKYGPKLIYGYATHVEPTSLWHADKGKFGKQLKVRVVEKLFTTDSIYNLGENEMVRVFKLNNI